MTTKQLEKKMTVTSYGRGIYVVTITYRGKPYYGHSTNSLAYDIWTSGENADYTVKQAGMMFYNKAKAENNLR